MYRLILALLLTPTLLVAQNRATVAGSFGGLSGAANLNPTGTANWRLGWVASLDATYWVHQNVGVRASGSWAQDSLDGATLGGRGKFNKFAYSGDLVLRYPNSSSVTPYAVAGAGAVSLHQLGSSSTFTKFAGDFGAGLEYRAGRWGIRAEGRDIVYKFDQFGFNRTQHDIAWQGGVTVAF